MTSGITQDQLTRAADDVLWAPKAERWSTLHKFYVFDRPLIFNELVDRFAKSEAELTNARADARALRDALDTAQKERDQLRQELSTTQINLHDHASGIAAVVKERDEAKAEVKCLVAMNEVLAKENEKARSTIEAKNRMLDAYSKQSADDRVARFWQLVIQRGMHPNDARELLHTAETIAKGLNKA